MKAYAAETSCIIQPMLRESSSKATTDPSLRIYRLASHACMRTDRHMRACTHLNLGTACCKAMCQLLVEPMETLQEPAPILFQGGVTKGKFLSHHSGCEQLSMFFHSQPEALSKCIHHIYDFGICRGLCMMMSRHSVM